MLKFLTSRAGAYVVLFLIAIAVFFYFKKKLADAGNAVNPVSRENIAYKGVNAVGGAITGKADFSLGSFIADIFPSDAEKQFTQSQVSKGIVKGEYQASQTVPLGGIVARKG